MDHLQGRPDPRGGRLVGESPPVVLGSIEGGGEDERRLVNARKEKRNEQRRKWQTTVTTALQLALARRHSTNTAVHSVLCAHSICAKEGGEREKRECAGVHWRAGIEERAGRIQRYDTCSDLSGGWDAISSTHSPTPMARHEFPRSSAA